VSLRIPILCALLLLTSRSSAKEPEREHHLTSEALACEVRFPGRAQEYRSDAGYGNGPCRHYHYVHREGEEDAEVERSLEVQLLSREPPNAEHAVAKAHEYQGAREGVQVLASERATLGAHRGLRARYRLAASDYEPERERRVQYVAVGRLLYKLSLTYPPGQPGMDMAWILFRGGFKLRAASPAADWIPHVSGAGGFGALFPAKPREELGGRSQVLRAEGARGSSFVVTSRPRPPGKRSELFSAAQLAARADLGEAVERSQRELGKQRREWVVTGEREGEAVVRVARAWVGKKQLITWSATGPEVLLSQLQAFARLVRPLRPLDPELLTRAEPATTSARLGAGEKLSGTSVDSEEGGFGSSRWWMGRAEFRLGDERYLERPALADYSSHWKLHRWRQEPLQLEAARGFLRTYFTRDGDEVLALHERVVVDAEGYSSHTLQLRNRALPWEQIKKLLAQEPTR